MVHKRSTALERPVDKESRCYTTGYVNWSSSDLKCCTGHRGYPGKGIMEDDFTRNPENWNNKSIKSKTRFEFHNILMTYQLNMQNRDKKLSVKICLSDQQGWRYGK